MLTGHTDVVPPTNLDQWDHDPFSGIVLDDDRLYGRGASDMKSGLVAAMEVFLAFVEGTETSRGA